MNELPSFNAELIIISDVHLKNVEESNANIFLNVLESIKKSKVDYLVLLGDIFDFCYFPSDYFQKKYAPVREALQNVAKTGIRIIFLEGNHEFHLKKMNWAGVECKKERFFKIKLSSGTTIGLAHGDAVYADLRYKLFRRAVKSWPFLMVARLIPARWLDQFALNQSETSRQFQVKKIIDEKKVLENANRLADALGCDHFVFGHFHESYSEVRISGNGLILGLSNWDEPNFLLFKNGKFERAIFKNRSSWQFEKTPAN
jgi:UDP-2,3-diacylglucosamine hydrolase